MTFQKLCQRPAANTTECSFEVSTTFKWAVPPYDKDRWVVSHLVRSKKGPFSECVCTQQGGTSSTCI